MKYLSVCSGIEAASVAWEPLGWEPLAFSEIEAFPRAVLQHHYPDVPLHGDFTELKDQPWIVDADLLCGGTPCQAFSVAGLRQSLADDRGNLTLQFVLLANAIDNLRRAAGRAPAWILWENVPGVLSTSDNAFGAFLGGLCGRDTAIPEPEGGWTRAGVVDGPARCAAWRTLDAQHFGVAQRRQRVFVLALGGAGRWAAADALLPIIESGRWHPAPRRGAGEGVAPTISARTKGGGGLGTNAECDGALIPEVAPTVTSKWAKGTGGPSGSETGNLVEVSGPLCVRMREGKEGGGKGPLVSNDQSLTLATSNDQVLAFDTTQITSPLNYSNPQVGDPRHPLAAGAHIPAIAQPVAAVHATAMQVRRLTPVECERLQGFPDNFTRIPWKKKPAEECPDGPRYKALGNSWAVPCARYIGEQIQRVIKP